MISRSIPTTRDGPGLSLARRRPALVLRLLQLRRPAGGRSRSSRCSRASSSSATRSSACSARRSCCSTPLTSPFTGLHRRPAFAPAADRGGAGVLERDLRRHGACRGTSSSSSLFRAAEGLGESFYFPASMSVLADYHGPRTRSRAMSIHQTSVYLGTAGGWSWAASSAQSPAGGRRSGASASPDCCMPCCSAPVLVEPPAAEPGQGEDRSRLRSTTRTGRIAAAGLARWRRFSGSSANPAAALLLGVFVGANFVAATFLTWLPSLVEQELRSGTGQFRRSPRRSGRWPASPARALRGLARRPGGAAAAGGRIRVQCLGLILAAPFVFSTGWSHVGRRAHRRRLVGAGLCKGIYDANIFASLFDVVARADRGTAAGPDEHRRAGPAGSWRPSPSAFASERFGLGAGHRLDGRRLFARGLLACVRRSPGRRNEPSETRLIRPDQLRGAAIVTVSPTSSEHPRPATPGPSGATSTPSSG